MKTNKDILSLIKNGSAINKIQDILEENGYPFVNVRSLRTVIDRLKKTEKTLKKSKRNENQLQAFYNSQFVPPKAAATKNKQQCTLCEELKSRVNDLQTEVAEERATSSHLAKQNRALKAKHMTYQPKRVNQMLKRKDLRISGLMKQVRELRENTKKLERTKHMFVATEIEKIKRQQVSNASYWKTNKSKIIKGLKERVWKLQEHNLNLEEENSHMAIKIEELAQNISAPIVTKENSKTYGSPIRKCIYFCLQKQVPVAHAADIVKFVVKEMTDRELTISPSKYCVSRMAREMGVIADLQGGQSLLSSKDSTLSWDGTTVKGTHLNEVHTTTEQGNLLLSVSSLAGGKTDDYAQDIVQTVNNIMGSYSEFNKIDLDDAAKKAKENISNTLTDRVAVNHCVVKELSNSFGKELNELNCNVHPLDSLAKEAKKILKKMETDKGIKTNLFGKEAVAINVILAVSKLKHKNGSGDPSSFNSFMRSNKIDSTLLPRFVGNRFHVMFKLAGSIYHLQEKLTEYLERWCPAVKLGQALLADLKTKEARSQLQALGLLGKLVTGPWMTNVYSNKENIHHLEMTPLFKKVLESLHAYKSTPESVLTSMNDAFAKTLDLSDDVLVSLRKDTENKVELYKIVAAICEGFITVLQRQLKSYLEGELSNPSEELLRETKSAPNHNMHAERVLAVADSVCRRAPNAKIDFVSSKVRFTLNRSMDWLQEQPNSKAMVDFAIKEGRELTRKRKVNDIIVEDTKIKRIMEKYQHKESRARNMIQKKVKVLVLKSEINEAELKEINDSLSNDKIQQCLCLMKEPQKFKGKSILHTWYDGETNTNEQYIGRICDIRNKDKDFIIQYDGDEEKIKLKRHEFITDFILADLEIM